MLETPSESTRLPVLPAKAGSEAKVRVLHVHSLPLLSEVAAQNAVVGHHAVHGPDFAVLLSGRRPQFQKRPRNVERHETDRRQVHLWASSNGNKHILFANMETRSVVIDAKVTLDTAIIGGLLVADKVAVCVGFARRIRPLSTTCPCLDGNCLELPQLRTISVQELFYTGWFALEVF